MEIDLFRSTPVGTSLIKVLNDMVKDNKISEVAAMEILKAFDESFMEVLKETTSGVKCEPVEIQVIISLFIIVTINFSLG